MQPIRLTIPDRYDRTDRLLAALGGERPAVEPSRDLHHRFLDSFDWRLYRAGLCLVQDGATWRLVELASGLVVATEPIWTDRWPRFAHDFPAGSDLGERLHGLLGVRALILILAAGGQQTIWRLADREHGTVLRGRCLELQPRREAVVAPPVAAAGGLAAAAAAVEPTPTPPAIRWFELHPDDAVTALAAAVQARAGELGCAPLAEPPLVLLLRAAGVAPGAYTSRFTARLAPHLDAREALVVVSRALVRALRQNEAGVTADVDTEFLHDFRVAVRRQRSALAIFKGVLPAATQAAFAREFAALGRLTGPLRDLDVKLLAESRWRELVPEDLQPGLEPLFGRLRARRGAELLRVREALASPAYRRLIAAWSACLAGSETGPRAATPARDLARRRLRRRFRRVLRDGRRIDPRGRGDADRLHRLRIQGKKLRYLLEFFASILPPREVAALVKQLKRLQDNLGAYNDLGVQLAHLQADRDRPDIEPGERDALAALSDALGAERRRVRKRFARTFAAFASPRVAERFARLLA